MSASVPKEIWHTLPGEAREALLASRRTITGLGAKLATAERQVRDMQHENDRLRREIARLRSAGVKP